MTKAEEEEARTILVLARAKAETVPPYALLALGRCYLALNHNEEAQEAFQQATEAAPDDPRGWSWLARAALGCGDLIAARRAAARTAELDPGNSDNHMLLGYVCWRQQDLSAAATALDRILQDAPDDPMARYLRDRVEATGRASSP